MEKRGKTFPVLSYKHRDSYHRESCFGSSVTDEPGSAYSDFNCKAMPGTAATRECHFGKPVTMRPYSHKAEQVSQTNQLWLLSARFLFYFLFYFCIADVTARCCTLKGRTSLHLYSQFFAICGVESKQIPHITSHMI